MPALVVPVDVAALCVGAPDVTGQDPGGIAMTLAPMADFSVLPYAAGGTVYNRGPYISADVLSNSGAFSGAAPLLQGIHLHWALPAGLSHAVQGQDGRQDFPAVPERWLVTRVVVDTATAGQPLVSTRSWVVESDRLSATPTAIQGLQQPTVPTAPTPGQNFRYLGASFDLPGWHEAGDPVERLAPFTAVGYGEPAFAGFYPSSCTSFGFLDPLTDLTGYSPATSTVSYHVAGWYGNSANDPLGRGDVVPGDNRYGWTWSGGRAPTATVCSGAVTGIPWDPATAYLDGTPQSLTVAVADTGPEALSALMASLLDGDLADIQATEQLLNALQFGLLSKSAKVDSQPTFEEAMHDAGFASLPGGSVWSVVTAGGSADGGDGGELTLPDALAGALNALNVLQLEADTLTRDVRARRQQLFADWYKYLLVLYESSQVPPAVRGQVAAVRDYLDTEAQAIGAIVWPGGTLDVLVGRVVAAAEAIRASLPATLSLRGDTAAAPYREPTDPVLVLSGADVTVAERHRRAGVGSTSAGLSCRLDSQLVSGVTLGPGLVPGSGQEEVAAAALPGLAALPDGAPAVLVQALLREAILLSPPLQPAVAAACAARGGTGNPAVLAFAATVDELQQAARQFVSGIAPPSVAYTGMAPDTAMLRAWTGTPWLPLLLQYEVGFQPMQYIDPVAGGRYAPGFVDASFQLPAGGVDLQYASGQPQALQLYSGSTLITGGIVADMAGEIQRFLSNTGNADPELATVLTRLQSLPLLAQRLTGVVQAMLMQALVLQMPVSDPLASQPQAEFAAEVAAAVGEENSVAPLPEESFNPLRTGALSIRQLRIVDAFGRFKDCTAPSVVLSSALQPPAALNLPAGTAFLPPRITQASRLLFRWLAASDDDVETNSHPATTPVVGWLVPNWPDRALAIYDAAGTALGELALSVDDTSVLWTPAPGGAFPPGAGVETVFSGQNPHLREFAAAVYADDDPAFLAPFFATVRESLGFTQPAAFRESAETAVLAGQPLALARAGLSLEVGGGTAPSQSWASFAARVLDNAPPDDAGLSSVRFPVRLGGPQRLDDSLVGFWVQQDGATDWLTFYAPGAQASQGGVQPPAQDAITLSPQPSSDVTVVLTLLLDPRGSVHATSGVLPAEQITIPPDHYTASVASLSLAMATHPVLSASGAAATSLALPKLSSGQWSWITVGDHQWQEAPTADVTSSAVLGYTSQQITEGWLVIQPGGAARPDRRGGQAAVTDHTIDTATAAQVTATLTNADGTPNVYITQDPTVNALTLTLTNGLGHAIVFPPGTPVAYENLPSGQSAVYIYLGGLIDNAGITGIKLSAPGWAAGTYTDPNSLQYLVIAPASEVTVQPGGALTFQLSNVLVQGSPRGGPADIQLSHADDVTSGQSDVSLFVNIANPPQPGRQALGIQIGFDTPAVYTGQPQSLTLRLVNGGQAALVPGGTTSWHGLTPTFQLTLVYGDGPGALTTAANAANIAMNISNEYGNVWQPPQRRVQGQSPYWIMQPDPDGGGTVLGTGAQASIEFAVTGIDAALPAGLDSAITLAYVSWHDIPGYNDGSTAVIITKKAGPRVTTFTADPPSVPFGESSVQTVLTWDTAYAVGVRFDAPQIGPSQIFWPSGSGPVEGGISVPAGTTLTLIAYQDISSDRRTTSGEVTQPANDVITATASLRLSGAKRTDISAGVASLGSIVIPAAAARAFLFQGDIELVPTVPHTQAAILDLSTHAITGTLDLSALIPSKGGLTEIECTVPSPDGQTIHVLVALYDDGKVEYYIVPLQVADAAYGQPVSLGALGQSGSSGLPALLTTPDGTTVYVSVLDVPYGSRVYALDAATYATKGSWTWQVQQDQQLIGPTVLAASNADGSALLMSGWSGLAIIDVSDGFTEKGTLQIGQDKVMLRFAVSPDATRVYYLYIYAPGPPSQSYKGLIAVDFDLDTGALSLANDIQLTQVPQDADAIALSPDGRTLYVLTGADTLTTFDTTTFTPVPYSCGLDDQFMPMLIVSGTQPDVLYCTGAGSLEPNGTVSVITFA